MRASSVGLTDSGEQAAGNADQAPAPSWWARPLLQIRETTVLRTVYYALLGATAAVLAIDFQELTERASAAIPPGPAQTQGPVVVEPAKPSDHVRPYLPFTAPVRRLDASPSLPGREKPPTSAETGQAMTFVRGPNGAASLVGRIEAGTAEAFARFIDAQAGEIRSVHLHSPGGSVRDALAMSKLIRDKAITTVVPQHAYCASSCPIVLAGGKQRQVDRQAWVGVHQIYAAAASPGTLGDGMAEAQAITGDVQAHLVEMGIDPGAWIPALKTPSDRLYVFTPEELETFKVATRLTGSKT